jgi:hypothetical protein
MSSPNSGPTPYAVSYSEHVRQELRALVARARERGLVRDVVGALRDFDARLRVYPQFGEPLRDLAQVPLQLWIGCVAPLVVRYVLDESARVVMVVEPIRPLSRAGLDP